MLITIGALNLVAVIFFLFGHFFTSTCVKLHSAI